MKTGTEFYPDYCQTDGRVSNDWAWRIGWSDGGELHALCPDGGDLAFAAKRDCQLAIDALTERGLKSYCDLEGMDRKVIREICCSALLW